MVKVEKGVAKLMKKYPGKIRPEIKSGLRGIRFFIEVPIIGHNIDAFSLILSTENILQHGKKDKGVKVVNSESYQGGENVSYKIDYRINSPTVVGGKSEGNIFIRGNKSDNGGQDSFKFVLEKNVDFHDLDTDMLINAVEHCLKVQQEPDDKANN